MPRTKRQTKIEQPRAEYLAGVDQARQATLLRLRHIVDRLPVSVIEEGASLDDIDFLAKLEESVAAETATRGAMNRALERGRKARRKLFQSTEMLSIEQAAEMLGIQPDSVRKKVSRNRLLALRMGAESLIPAFQIREGEILPGVPEVVEALEGLGSMTKLDWFMTPHPNFDDQPPYRLLPVEKARVVQTARRFGSQGGT